MATDQDAKLFDVLAGGYHLATQLQALLGGRRPLDGIVQQEAMAFSQELSRVFKVSMSMLNGSAVTGAKTAPAVRTGAIVQAVAKDKRARSDSGEEVTPARSREDGVTRKEITASPYKDGYVWRKYGQKNIQNCNFVRYYFRCSRDRRCEAKKKVQQQDDGSHLPPMFEVTYLNEHTCHALRATATANGDAAVPVPVAASPPTTNRRWYRDDDGGLQLDLSSFPRMGGGGGGGSAQENETIVSCLADVIRGAAPPPPPPSPWPPVAAAASDAAAASYGPAPMQMQMMQASGSGHSASVAQDGGATMMTTMIGTDDTDFSWDPSLAGHPDQDHRDMLHVVDVNGLADTVWPRHTPAGAWHCPLCPQI